jgi:hypothetical protein
MMNPSVETSLLPKRPSAMDVINATLMTTATAVAMETAVAKASLRTPGSAKAMASAQNAQKPYQAIFGLNVPTTGTTLTTS